MPSLLRRGGESDCEPCGLQVPAMCEHYRKLGLDHRKIVGVTSLHVVNANKFTSSLTGSSMRVAQNPVIGGHASVTIFPPLSQCLVGSSSPWIRWRIWTSVCKMEASNWSWRKLQPGWQLRALRVRTRSVSATTLLKRCTHSVECDIIDQTWVMSDQEPVKQGDTSAVEPDCMH